MVIVNDDGSNGAHQMQVQLLHPFLFNDVLAIYYEVIVMYGCVTLNTTLIEREVIYGT